MNFENLIKTNKESVKNIIKLVTKQENEDLEQEVYIKVLKSSHNYTEQGLFKSWINTVAKNISKDYLKSAQKRVQDNSMSDDITLNSIEDTKLTPELRLIKTERQEKITAAIKALAPKLREAVILIEIEGYSYEECAHKLKVPTGTVKSRLYNAKKQLAEMLKELL